MTSPDSHPCGEVLRRRRVAGLVLAEVRHAPGARVARHAHDGAFLCLVRHGGYDEVHGTRARACGPLTVTVHPAGEAHALRPHGDGAVCFHVAFPAGWAARFRARARALERPAVFHGGPVAGLALRLYREFRRRDRAAPLAVLGLALELLAEACRAGRGAGRRPLWLDEVRDALDRRFAGPVTLADLAALAGVHPVHLATAFRRHLGCTVGQYLRRRRVEYACRQLTATAAPLAQVALAAGFADQSHFSRTFKGLMGLSPAAYRRLAGPGA